MITSLTKNISPFAFPLTHLFHNTFFAASSIIHYRHHTNYPTEPPTGSTIFPMLPYYDHAQILQLSVNNIFNIFNNFKYYFSFHYEPPLVLTETVMIIIDTIIIIAKATKS